MGAGGASGRAYLGPVFLTRCPVGVQSDFEHNENPSKLLIDSYRHGLLSCTFLKMGNLEICL